VTLTLPRQPDPAPSDDPWPRLDLATVELSAPLAVIDRQAAARNAVRLVQRAAGTPVRLATKSLRSRALLSALLATDGYAGLMAHAAAEAVWLVRSGTSDDVLIGYPTVARGPLTELCADERLAASITVTVDDPAQLDLIDVIALPHQRPEVRVCLDLDAGLAAGPVRVGARRSALRTRAQAVALARTIADRPGFRLVGALAYEAQVAGVPDRGGSTVASRLSELAVTGVKAVSVRELAARRRAIVAGLREVTDLEFVNGGGTGSIESTAADPSITEVAAGSGILLGHLFDRFRSFRAEPACGYALDVDRVPSPDLVVVHGGGWIASGPSGADRSPQPVHPPGLRTTGAEAVGEVQTPLRVPRDLAGRIRLGDRVWFRHAKSGEVAEHVNEFVVVDGDAVVATIPTYRGEGKVF